MLKTTYFIVVFVALYQASCIFGFGQGCPAIEIVPPAGLPNPGDSFVVKAAIKGSIGVGSLKYDWTTSFGVIENGQGSDQITVRTSREDEARNISIKVIVSGLSSVCDNTASEVFSIAALPTVCDFTEEFGADKANDVKARVDNIYIVLENNPNTVVLFDMEFIDSETPKQRTLRITRILDAIKFREYDMNKAIFLISKEKKRTATKIRILPLSADMSGFLDQGSLIYGQDMKQKLPTLFRNK